jgi:hypothetical protein
MAIAAAMVEVLEACRLLSEALRSFAHIACQAQVLIYD